MKNKWIIVLAIVIVVIFFLVKANLKEDVIEEGDIVLYEFWGNGCPHCASLDRFLDSIEGKYPDLKIKKYETWYNNKNKQLMLEMGRAYGVNVQGVPAVFINDKFISGFNIEKGNEIEQEIQKCLIEECENPGDRIG
tara:strand:+ start:163 stop:573 length:411 start_codon:yes stop_codon:yes gene_type:complete